MVQRYDTEVDSKDEGMELLLGELAVSAITLEAWDDEEVDNTNPPADASLKRNKTANTQETAARNIQLLVISSMVEEKTCGGYDRAFHCEPNGQLVRPPVRITCIDMVSSQFCLRQPGLI